MPRSVAGSAVDPHEIDQRIRVAVAGNHITLCGIRPNSATLVSTLVQRAKLIASDG